MLSAPAPNSNAGSGSQSPLRTKPPTVVRYESGASRVGFVGVDALRCRPSRRRSPTFRFGLILVTPSSAENWKPGEAERVGRRHQARRDHDAQLGHQAAEARLPVDVGHRPRHAARWRRAGPSCTRACSDRAGRDSAGCRSFLPARARPPARARQPRRRRGGGADAAPWKGHCRVRYGLASKGVKEAACELPPRRVMLPASVAAAIVPPSCLAPAGRRRSCAWPLAGDRGGSRRRVRARTRLTDGTRWTLLAIAVAIGLGWVLAELFKLGLERLVGLPLPAPRAAIALGAASALVAGLALVVVGFVRVRRSRARTSSRVVETAGVVGDPRGRAAGAWCRSCCASSRCSRRCRRWASCWASRRWSSCSA